MAPRNGSSLLTLVRALVVSAGLLTVACGNDPPVGPNLGKGGAGPAGGKTSLTVSAADPDTIPIDTTLTVRILGSGFESGATVEYLLGSTVSSQVTATKVTFVSPSELATTTVVARAATLGSYSVAVTSGGKRGIGVEKVEVVAKLVMLTEPAGGVTSGAFDVNDAGTIVGWMADAADGFYAVRWQPVGNGWQGAVLGSGSAVAVNAAGDIIRRDSDGNTPHSWVLLHDGGAWDLGAGSYANGISDDGTVIGSIKTGLISSYVVWVQTGARAWSDPIVMPSKSGYSNSDLNGISSDGQWIAGHVYDATRLEWAVVWTRQQNSWIGPVMVDATYGGTAMSVNSSGAVAGAIWPCTPGPGCVSQWVYWPSPGAPRQLLPTDGWARTFDISNANQVVGYAQLNLPGKRGRLRQVPALWPAGAPRPIDLGTPNGSSSGEAHAINQWRVVVGVVSQSGSSSHAVAWIVP